MANFLQSIAGMGDLTEQVIATDFLIAAKSGVRNYAFAVSEAVTPEVRAVLRRHLEDAIGTYEGIFQYMTKMGYYHANDPAEQIKVDLKAADTVLDIQSQ